jgi:hypothetical protein
MAPPRVRRANAHQTASNRWFEFEGHYEKLFPDTGCAYRQPSLDPRGGEARVRGQPGLRRHCLTEHKVDAIDNALRLFRPRNHNGTLGRAVDMQTLEADTKHRYIRLQWTPTKSLLNTSLMGDDGARCGCAYLTFELRPVRSRGVRRNRVGCPVKVRIAYVFHLCRRGFVRHNFTQPNRR